ncbi:MAG: polysaccharide deacetylase family protein [Bacteroidota bacterium]
MNIRRQLNLVNKLFPLKLLAEITSQKILLPFYHTVSDLRLPHISHLYPLKTKRQFISDIDYLCKHFTPISIDELKDKIHRDQSIKKPVFHLTFDDGLKEVYTEIAPILVEKGIPATIFLNTDFIRIKLIY